MILVEVSGEKNVQNYTTLDNYTFVFLNFKHLATTFLQLVGKVCFLHFSCKALDVEETFIFFLLQMAPVPSNRTSQRGSGSQELSAAGLSGTMALTGARD